MDIIMNWYKVSMNWIQKHWFNSPHSTSSYRNQKSEEINDIVNKMPMVFGRWVAIGMAIFTLLFLLLGWIIKYPDTVVGQIKINSQYATIRLVANTSGSLHLFTHKAQVQIQKGDYIAIIQNPAITEDVRKIIGLISHFNPSKECSADKLRLFPDKVSLADLNLKYYTFLSALKTQCDYENENIYEKQKGTLLNDIKWKETLIDEATKMLDITQERLEISKKWLDKYISLDSAKIATYEYEVDQVKNNYLSIKQEVQNIIKDIAAIQMQITANFGQLKKLETEKKEKERNMKLDLLSSFHDLNDNIKAWEQKYVFKAPIDGHLEYLQFLSDGKFIEAGEEVFGIIPQESNIYGQVSLPAKGAGKVKIGSRVAIKLDNYPYIEYGSIEGWVTSISLVTQPQKVAEKTVETYLININLPNGLKTNYGEVLDFKSDLGGTADIIVKERRLIERLFDNLKYKTR